MKAFDEIWKGLKTLIDNINIKIWAQLWHDTVAQDFLDAQQQAAKDLGVTYQMHPRQVMDYFRDHGTEFVKTLTETDKKLFKEVLEKYHGLPFDQFKEKLGDKIGSEARMRTIYTTEKHNAYTIGYDDYVKDHIETTGVQIWKTWRHGNSKEPRPEHLAMEGITVRFDEDFPNGERVPTGINCSCWIEYRDKPPASSNSAIITNSASVASNI